ncbi:MAG TPA: hypothetical protein VEB86_13840 [Chryseosolibacter sp.]|nr:hypothetical protein [Chryseosolibacter sp.]
MNLKQPCLHILNQLGDLVGSIQDQDFSRPSNTLSNSTLGQHLRHTLEFFICMEEGSKRGVINYDKRDHDKLIESDRILALDAIGRIKKFIQGIESDKSLKLEVGYDLNEERYITVETNVTRELVYNIEHAVHHMAIMKIGIREVAPYIELPFDFGVAASTVRYKQTAHAAHKD